MPQGEPRPVANTVSFGTTSLGDAGGGAVTLIWNGAGQGGAPMRRWGQCQALRTLCLPSSVGVNSYKRLDLHI